jgi:hypothetical protein
MADCAADERVNDQGVRDEQRPHCRCRIPSRGKSNGLLDDSEPPDHQSLENERCSEDDRGGIDHTKEPSVIH